MTAFIDRKPAKVLYDNGTFKVIEQHRVQQCRPTGLKPEWIEYQVRQGRKIIARHEFMGPAIKDAQERAHKEWEVIGAALKQHNKDIAALKGEWNVGTP